LPRYETVFVLDPSLDDKAIQKEIKRVEDLITEHKGEVLKTNKWGKRRLTYPIKKKHEGYYTLILFQGEGRISKELERAYKLNESCLRYMTVTAEGEEEPIVSEGKEQEAKEHD
jgi:small subunit ribosomal protein S6